MGLQLKYSEWQAMIRLPYYVFFAVYSSRERKQSSNIELFINQLSDYARNNKGTLNGQLIADSLHEHESILITTLKMSANQILDELRMAIFRLRETMNNENRLQVVEFLKQLYCELGGASNNSPLANHVNEILQMEAKVTA
jgi:hypothetical protein